MIGVMMMLGQFKFSLSTAAYQAFSRSSNFRWQACERFGQMPAFQYTGPGSDEITLSGAIYPSFAGDSKQIDWIRYYAGQGKPLTMVDGRGYVWGKWVILSVDEDKEVFFSDGVARKQSFNLKISRYIDDIPGSSTNWKIEYQGTRQITSGDNGVNQFKNSMVRHDTPRIDPDPKGYQEFKSSMKRIK